MLQSPVKKEPCPHFYPVADKGAFGRRWQNSISAQRGVQRVKHWWDRKQKWTRRVALPALGQGFGAVVGGN